MDSWRPSEKVRIMDELMRRILGQIFWGVTIASSKRLPVFLQRMQNLYR
jgi:hypothetical protein